MPKVVEFGGLKAEVELCLNQNQFRINFSLKHFKTVAFFEVSSFFIIIE